MHALLVTLLTSNMWSHRPVRDLGIKPFNKPIRLSTAGSLAGCAGS